MKMAILEWMTLKFYEVSIWRHVSNTRYIHHYQLHRFWDEGKRSHWNKKREKRKEYVGRIKLLAFDAIVIDWCFLFSTTLCSESANSEYDWTYNSEFYADHCPFSVPINLASCFFFILLSYLAKCHRMHWKQFNRIPIRVKILHLHYHSRSHR